MHSRSENTNQLDLDARNSRMYTIASRAWWCGTADNDILRENFKESTSNLPSLKQPCGALRTKASKSQANGGHDRGDDTNSEMQTTLSRQSDGNFKHEQHLTSRKSPTMGKYLAPPQQELIGHSIACTSYPYPDLHYGGLMPDYGPQAMVHSNALGPHHTRTALPAMPLEVTEEPVYVNAKQYHGILRRRQSRAKAELEKKLIRARKPYLHESRHRHAMRRARGSGGRFVNSKKLDSAAPDITSDKDTGSGVAVSANWINSLGSKSAPSNYSGNAAPSAIHKEVQEPSVQLIQDPSVWDTQRVQPFSNSNANVKNQFPCQHGFQISSCYYP